jgi:hypothetical protein
MRDRFTTKEWKLLTLMPAMVFHMVAMSDREVAEKEMMFFGGELADPETTKNDLHRELLKAFTEAPQENLHAAVTLMEKDMAGAFGACNQVLEQNLTGKERQSFLASLMVSAIMLSHADDEAHQDETEIISAFGSAFGIELDSLKAEMAHYQD